MDDETLLTLAARAYDDKDIIKGLYPTFQRYIGENEDLGCDVFVNWDLLTDDGDAHRLQVALKADLLYNFDADNQWTAVSYDAQHYVKDPDPKRAMVLLAAAIAEQGEKE